MSERESERDRVGVREREKERESEKREREREPCVLQRRKLHPSGLRLWRCSHHQN